jgi:hypothetical protein
MVLIIAVSPAVFKQLGFCTHIHTTIYLCANLVHHQGKLTVILLQHTRAIGSTQLLVM